MFQKLFETVDSQEVSLTMGEYKRLVKSDMQLQTIVKMIDEGFTFDTIVDVIKFFDIKK